MTASDVASRLSDQIQDMHRGTGHYATYPDHAGDDKSGDVIYSVDGNTVSAPYEMSKDEGGAAKTYIHADKATNVVPRTVYDPEADQDELDQYAQMSEAALYTRGPIPLVERNVPKSERDAADSSDFAGKGKSFPILKAEDVDAAFHALGRAGAGNYSTDVIRKNIIKIAKRKGFPLPKSAQDDSTSTSESRRVREAKPMKDCPDCKGSGADGDDDCDTCDGTGKVPAFKKSKESRAAIGNGSLSIREMTTRPTDDALDLLESATGSEMEIKLIAPGKGSSAFYTPEALKQAAADKVFDKGTQIYINHATRSEESERPEGDWHKLVGALKEPAYWQESHREGPGLYARAAFAPDMAPLIKAKAPYSGMSIRANGEAVIEAGRPQLKEGVPLLKKFTSAESVDIVTKAGAGGMILTESAREAQGETGMTAEEKALLSRLVEKDVRREAIELGARTLEGVSLNEAAKMYIIETVVDKGVPKAAGALDATKFTEAINAEARRFGSAIGAGPRVTGMGVAPPVELTEAQRSEIKARETAANETYTDVWAGLLDVPKTNTPLLERAMKGRTN